MPLKIHTKTSTQCHGNELRWITPRIWFSCVEKIAGYACLRSWRRNSWDNVKLTEQVETLQIRQYAVMFTFGKRTATCVSWLRWLRKAHLFSFAECTEQLSNWCYEMQRLSNCPTVKYAVWGSLLTFVMAICYGNLFLSSLFVCVFVRFTSWNYHGWSSWFALLFSRDMFVWIPSVTMRNS